MFGAKEQVPHEGSGDQRATEADPEACRSKPPYATAAASSGPCSRCQRQFDHDEFMFMVAV
jgi:hypothetical protein